MRKLTRELIEQTIPHGSGINGEWWIEDKGSYWKCANGFQVMNDVGYYVGWAHFSLVLPKRNPEGFRLHFHGRRSHYLARRYNLRDYLEDIFAWWIEDLTRQGR